MESLSEKKQNDKDGQTVALVYSGPLPMVTIVSPSPATGPRMTRTPFTRTQGKDLKLASSICRKGRGQASTLDYIQGATGALFQV